MYDESTRLHLFEFDSGFSESDDVDEVAVDDGGMDADIEGSGDGGRMDANVEGSGDGGGMDANVEGSGFVQQLARVLLNFFVGGIVCLIGIVYFFYCSMLILQRLLRVFTRNSALLLDASCCFVFSCE